MNELCPKCQKVAFEKIKDIFFYNMPDRYNKLEDPEIIAQMKIEDDKAQEFLKQYFAKIYPGRVYE